MDRGFVERRDDGFYLGLKDEVDNDMAARERGQSQTQEHTD
jgi:hypothetical protein